MDAPAFAQAIQCWKGIVGERFVETDPSALKSFCQNVSALQRSVLAVLKPSCAEEIQQIVQIANEFKIPLYPISCGRNWGMGSRLPVRDGAVVVDLGRMNRIREVNVEHHYAVVEPGVTQGQLYDYLCERRLPLVLNVIGSGRNTSLIGNALDRGVAYFSSRADSLSGIDVVLGNGERIQTGFGSFPQAQTTFLYRHGTGPSLDGLFAQSNFGIVTSAAIDLIPKREEMVCMLATLRDPKKLGEFVEVLRRLRQQEIIQTVVHIANRHRSVSALTPEIYEYLKRTRQGSAFDLRKIAEEIVRLEIPGIWTAGCGLMGTAGQLKEIRIRIKKALTKLARITFLNDRTLARLQSVAKGLSFIPSFARKSAVLHAMEPLYGLTKGIPTDAALRSVYWPLNDEPMAGVSEPDQSQSGQLYCLPMIPMNAKSVDEVVAGTESIFKKYGFETYITLNMVNTKALEGVINLVFRRDQQARVDAAHACIEEWHRQFIEKGYIPYRLGIQSMSQVIQEKNPYWRLVRDLKKVFDPNRIIAPGRYNLV